MKVSGELKKKSGVKGVFWDKARQKWDAEVYIDCKKRHKRFDNLEDAIAYRESFEQAKQPSNENLGSRDTDEESIHGHLNFYMSNGAFQAKLFVEDLDKFIRRNPRVKAMACKSSLFHSVMFSICYMVGGRTLDSWEIIEDYLFKHYTLREVFDRAFAKSLEWRGLNILSGGEMTEQEVYKVMDSFIVTGAFHIEKFFTELAKYVLSNQKILGRFTKNPNPTEFRNAICNFIGRDKPAKWRYVEIYLYNRGVIDAVMESREELLRVIERLQNDESRVQSG